MILFDANVLLNAHRSGQDHHGVARELLETVVNAAAPFAISEAVLGAFLRIATNPRAFAVPTPLDVAFRFADGLLRRHNARVVRAGERHWLIFEDLCRRTQPEAA